MRIETLRAQQRTAVILGLGGVLQLRELWARQPRGSERNLPAWDGGVGREPGGERSRQGERDVHVQRDRGRLLYGARPATGRGDPLRRRVLVRTVDNYAPNPTNDVQRSVAGLADGVHVVRIVLAEGLPAAKGTLASWSPPRGGEPPGRTPRVPGHTFTATVAVPPAVEIGSRSAPSGYVASTCTNEHARCRPVRSLCPEGTNPCHVPGDLASPPSPRLHRRDHGCLARKANVSSPPVAQPLATHPLGCTLEGAPLSGRTRRVVFQAEIVIVRVTASPGRVVHHQFPTVSRASCQGDT
jgi:hypothetical protein